MCCDLCIAPHIPDSNPCQGARNRIGNLSEVEHESFNGASIKANLCVAQTTIVDKEEIGNFLIGEFRNLCVLTGDINFSSSASNELSADEVIECNGDAVGTNLRRTCRNNRSILLDCYLAIYAL